MAPASATARIILAACFFFLPLSFRLHYVADASPPLSFSFDFSNTSKYRLQDLRFEGAAALKNGRVDLTVNSDNLDDTKWSSGRMSYNHPVAFYDNNTGNVASFVTTFTFAINFFPNTTKGDGLAFFLSGYPSRLPYGSYGSVFGLKDWGGDPLGQDRFVAVEFDTFCNPRWDPTGSNDHIGIDINNITSVSTTKLPSYSLNGTMTATITFDNTTRTLEATLHFDADRSLAPVSVKTQLPDLLDALLPPEVAVGFSAGTGGYSELHQILSWTFDSPPAAARETSPGGTKFPTETPPGATKLHPEQGPVLDTKGSGTFYSPKKGSHTVAIVTGVVVVPGAAALLAACCFYCRRYRSRTEHKTQEEDVTPTGQSLVTTTPDDPNSTTTHSTSSGTISDHGQATTTPSGSTTKKENGQEGDSILDLPRRFPYVELAQATSNFNGRNKLGQGAFGVVYEGRLPGVDLTMAIKVILETPLLDITQVKRAFYSEIKITSQLHHRNILSLKGWCDEGNHLLLIYEKMENGSLEDHLYPKNGTMDTAVYGETGNDTRPSSHLNWVARRNILIGIASGLAYLHKECQTAIVHRDLKPANILLDRNRNARLSDFGLVTQVRHTETSRPTDNIIGTQSYIDPAYKETGKVSGQCDVYSLGVVLLEIACGKKPLILEGSGKNSLIEMVRECDGRNKILDAADRGLRGQFDDEIEAVLRLGLNCVLPDRHSRPHTGRVRDRLTKLVDGAGSAPSTSNSRRPSGEVTHSHANEEAGISPLLA